VLRGDDGVAREKLSLIIPTHNRPPYLLERLLRYFVEVGLAYPIVVADSSGEPAADANQAVLTSLGDALDVRYVGYRPDMNPYSKIAASLDMVESKYSAICADDDFLVPRAIEKCVQFLESNPDYAAAHGRLVSMYPLRVSRGVSKLWTYSCCQHTIDSADPCLRLRAFVRLRSDFLFRPTKIGFDAEYATGGE